MRTKILMLVVMLGLSAGVMAQLADNGPGKSFRGHDREMRRGNDQTGPKNGLNLTDAQKEAWKQSMMEAQKQIQPLRNELGEAKAHQKTLMTAEKPDMGAINKNIEKIGDIKVEIEKIQAAQRLKMRAQLTDEQLLKIDNQKDRMMLHKGFRRM
jgi:Spy/CpxP family protein refolding chaperone